jgi:DNA gyrase/topoisomerase IV subunit A
VEANPKRCLKYLTFDYAEGGTCVSPDSVLLNYYKTGTERLIFKPSVEKSYDKRMYVLTSLSPNFNWSSFFDNVIEWPDVDTVNDATTDKIRLEVIFKKGLSKDKLTENFKALDKEILRGVSLLTNVTIREGEDEKDISFKSTTIPEILNDWLKWRIDLEKKALLHRKGELLKFISEEELILKVIASIQLVIKAIRKNHKNGEMQLKAVCNVLKCSPEEGERVLRMPLRSVGRLNQDSVLEKKKTLETELKNVKAYLKTPEVRVAEGLQKMSDLV